MLGPNVHLDVSNVWRGHLCARTNVSASTLVDLWLQQSALLFHFKGLSRIELHYSGSSCPNCWLKATRVGLKRPGQGVGLNEYYKYEYTLPLKHRITKKSSANSFCSNCSRSDSDIPVRVCGLH